MSICLDHFGNYFVQVPFEDMASDLLEPRFRPVDRRGQHLRGYEDLTVRKPGIPEFPNETSGAFSVMSGFGHERGK